jgi:predicted CoA-binding protein
MASTTRIIRSTSPGALENKINEVIDDMQAQGYEVISVDPLDTKTSVMSVLILFAN